MRQHYFMRVIFIMACLMLCARSGAAQKLMGLVIQKNHEGIEEPVVGANVHWLGTTVATTTGFNGIFRIDRHTSENRLIISFIGMKSDTVVVSNQTNLKVELQSEMLREITVEGWKPSSGLDHARGINTVVMAEKELFKAACCNLSESFETNPSVDVAFTDAITGTRQIQMLGLSGPNTLITIENMPGVRGLASSQGIQLIPGTWINSIEVTKGVGSVVNGYESIAGQINVELKKPQESEKLYLNGYLNQSGRSEANVNYTAMTGKKWATTFLLHGSTRPFEMDQNKDSFIDFPTGSQLNAINRWVFNSGNGWLGQVGVKILRDEKFAGQAETMEMQVGMEPYRVEIKTDRKEIWGKFAYVFPAKPYKSAAIQLSGTDHDHTSSFDMNMHNGTEKSGYANLIYQSIISNTNHRFKAGLSFLYDQYNEKLTSHSKPFMVDGQQVMHELQFDRTEKVPGIFGEYTFDYNDKINIIAGLRMDRHNLFGNIITPRLHVMLNPAPATSIRMSAGKGTRIANVLIENSGVLASSRQIIFSNLTSTRAYGFKPDVAWNYGFNVSQDFNLNYRPGTLSFDYYFTDFQSQVVTDLDHSAREVNFRGLAGKSYAHSVQVQLDYEIVRRFDVRLAYRLLDVKTAYMDGLLSRPLIPRQRAFINLAYETRNKWKFDVTAQWIGTQRVPSTLENPAQYQLPGETDPYYLVNGQVAKDMGKRWSMYLGIENAGNFRLKNPIVASDDPYGNYFDSSLVWGPIFGRMVYTGFRYRVK